MEVARCWTDEQTWLRADGGCLRRAAVNLHGRFVSGPSSAEVGRPRPAVEPMSRPDYGPTAVVYGGPLSTYMDGSSAAHLRLMAVGRPRPAVEPMSRPDYGPTAVAYGGPLSTYMDGSSAAHRRLIAVGRLRPAVEPMSRPDYGPTAVAYGGPLSTYMDGSSAAHRRLTAVGRPRSAVEPMSRPDYGPTAVAINGPLLRVTMGRWWAAVVVLSGNTQALTLGLHISTTQTMSSSSQIYSARWKMLC